MGISPKFRRGARRGRAPVAAESPPAAEASERATRPIPQRVEPRRTADTLLRQDSVVDSVLDSAVAPNTPVEEGVHAAYQVFDKYLEEGRQFAEGQSAWYQNDTGEPELTRDVARGLADFLGLLGRVAKELGTNGGGAGVPDVAAALSTLPGVDAPRQFHPQQDPAYPTGARSAESGDEWEPVDVPSPVLTEEQAQRAVEAAPEVLAAIAQTAKNLNDLRPDELAPLDPADLISRTAPKS